ncbi:MAG: hypothetical protein ACREH3_06720, partial [Geminicoccales bacterium]
MGERATPMPGIQLVLATVAIGLALVATPAFAPIGPGAVVLTSLTPEIEMPSIADVPRLVHGMLGVAGHPMAAGVAPSMGVFDLASPALFKLDGLA